MVGSVPVLVCRPSLPWSRPSAVKSVRHCMCGLRNAVGGGKEGGRDGAYEYDRAKRTRTPSSSSLLNLDLEQKKKRVYDTAYSRVVTLPSTDAASTSLDSVSETGTVAFSCVWP